MSYHYKIVIIGDTKPYHEKVTGGEEISLERGGVTYKGSRSQAFIEEYGFIDRWFKKLDREYWLIFREKEKSSKDDENTVYPIFPPNTAQKVNRVSDNRKFSSKSANLLWRVHKYRGVKPAFRDEFKEPWNFPKIPIWALIPIVLVLLGVVGYILFQSGSLETIIKIFTGGANPEVVQ